MSESDFSLSEHHQDLERHFQRLVVRFQGGDPLDIRSEWLLFERELNQHFELEEREIIPAFRREYPAAAAQICREHDEIRSALAELGIRLDLHTLRTEAVSEFVEQLRRHAQREDELLYPWGQKHTPQERWRSVGQQLGALSRKIGAAFGAEASTFTGRSH